MSWVGDEFPPMVPQTAKKPSKCVKSLRNYFESWIPSERFCGVWVVFLEWSLEGLVIMGWDLAHYNDLLVKAADKVHCVLGLWIACPTATVSNYPQFYRKTNQMTLHWSVFCRACQQLPSNGIYSPTFNRINSPYQRNNAIKINLYMQYYGNQPLRCRHPVVDTGCRSSILHFSHLSMRISR